MKTRRLRLVRPKWTLGTMLIFVAWSAVVGWLNCRLRVKHYDIEGIRLYSPRFGFPYPMTYGVLNSDRPTLTRFHPEHGLDSWALAANAAIGLLAVAVLTFASKYLARAIVSRLGSFMSKPPPGKGKGPERATRRCLSDHSLA